jgi:predicted phosphodiesterase
MSDGDAGVNGGLAGLLFIGDPHAASRAPGFRKDDYARTILGKIRWAIEYALAERLTPFLLGDLFDFPRDNANWLIVELMDLFSRCPGGCTWGVYGNHDCKENELGDNDTLSVLVAGGQVRLLDRSPWRGTVNGCPVVVGGTSWGRELPDAFERGSADGGRVFWLTHHDLRFPGYEEQARMGCREIAGVDLAINGHIHRALGSVVRGQTTWLNPGNITRVSRGDATRAHEPAVLRVDVAQDGAWTAKRVTVPHLPFDEVFHPEVASEEARVDDSVFIRELAALESVRTSGGAGLRSFLDANLPQFAPRTVEEIEALAREVLTDGR